MKTALVILASVLLVLGIVGVGFAAELNQQATVTVNSYASVTISACADPLSFGSGDPGATDLAVSCQTATTPAISVTNDPVSNQDITVETKGTDFTYDTYTIAVSNIEFDKSNAKSSPTVLSTTYQTSSTGVSPGTTVGIWYWLDIPNGQAAGDYSGTLSVRGQ